MDTSTMPRPVRIAAGAALLGTLPWRLAGSAVIWALESVQAISLANAHAALDEHGWEDLRLTTEIAQLAGLTRTPVAAAR